MSTLKSPELETLGCANCDEEVSDTSESCEDCGAKLCVTCVAEIRELELDEPLRCDECALLLDDDLDELDDEEEEDEEEDDELDDEEDTIG